MNRDEFDVATIGAGAAGIGAAESLTAAGHGVPLVDRAARPDRRDRRPLGTHKPTGDALATLARSRGAPRAVKRTSLAAAPHEHARTLVDLMFRRTGEGRDDARVRAEVAAYRAHVGWRHQVNVK